MKNHPDSALVVEAGCVALNRLFEEKDRSIDALGRQEMDAVASAMQVRRENNWELRDVPIKENIRYMQLFFIF